MNTPDNSGYTPLHYAARKGHVDICKILLQNGALIDAKTNSGQATPLHKAAAAGNHWLFDWNYIYNRKLKYPKV